MAFIASALALRSIWQVRIRAALTLGVVWTGYMFREADQCPTLPCSGQPVVLTCYCGCVVRIKEGRARAQMLYAKKCVSAKLSVDIGCGTVVDFFLFVAKLFR